MRIRSKHIWRIWTQKTSASSFRNGLIIAVIALSGPAAGVGQGVRVSGRVDHVVSNDTIPLAGQQVVLHSVVAEGGRPIDSTETNRQGNYSLTSATLDTTAAYLVSVEYHGVGYFSQPIAGRDSAVSSAAPLLVYDTSSTQPRVFLSSRNMIVNAPRANGSRQVIELLTLKNAGHHTRIADATGSAVWQGAIPTDALQFSIGEADVSPDAIQRHGDTISVFAPIPPGQKQILLSYLLPRTTEVSFSTLGYMDQMFVLVQEPGGAVTTDDFEFYGVDELGELSFGRYAASDLDAGTRVILELPRPPLSPQNFIWVVVVAVGLALSLGFWLWTRRRASSPGSGATTSSDGIAAQIAALDAEFEAKGDNVVDEERAAYEERREQLKRQLSEALSNEGRSG